MPTENFTQSLQPLKAVRLKLTLVPPFNAHSEGGSNWITVKKTLIKGLQFTEGTTICWINVNYVKLFCGECPDRFYSLQRGLVTGLDIYKGTECLKCPLGASCENGNVKAKDNFWGLNIFFKSTKPEVLFPVHWNTAAVRRIPFTTLNGCYSSRTDVFTCVASALMDTVKHCIQLCVERTKM